DCRVCTIRCPGVPFTVDKPVGCMIHRKKELGYMLLFLSWCPNGFAQAGAANASSVPATWDDAAISKLEVPLANPVGSPRHVRADYYYKIPVRPIYKSYPVYAPGVEPAGYMDWLKSREPEILWNDSGIKPQLKNDEDWLNAGEIVFDAPIL